MKYKATVEIDKETLGKWNFLLSKDLCDMTEDEIKKYNATKDIFEGGFLAKFDNDSYITIDLHSGNENYFDNIVWHSADEKRSVAFDCMYKIDVDNPNEFNVGDDVYVINWKVIEE